MAKEPRSASSPRRSSRRTRAEGSQEEALQGGSVTPDHDTVDELGDALGVPQAPDAEFRPTAEILEARDRDRWEQER